MWERNKNMIDDLKNMSFIEALEYINNGNYLTYMCRDDWPFKLYFCPLSQHLMIKYKDELTPYVISVFDFDYQWSVCE